MSKSKSYPIKTLTIADDGDFILESGETFGPVTIAYETWGTLNSSRDNAILVIHALTGDTHACSVCDKDDTTPGWWDNIIGAGKAIDTDRYFVICSNYFGGCSGTTGPSSINPATGKPYGLTFPIITVTDMLNVQKAMVDHLGITRLKAIVGGSLGGMLVLEWSILYPDTLENAVVIASSHRSSSQGIAFGEVGRNSIMADPDFMGGNYYEDKPPDRGLSIARMLAHITYLSKDAMETKFGRDIKDEIREADILYGVFGPMFQVESYLRYQGKKFVDRFDANSYMYITKAMDMYDITRGNKNLVEKLEKVNCRMLVISFTSDWHFPPSESWDIVKALMNHGKKISYVNLPSPYGHDAFLIKNEQMERMISGFISRDRNGHEKST